MTAGVTVREADPDEVVTALRVIEGALLEVDAGDVRERAAAGDLLVAETGGSVVGAVVLDPAGGGTGHVDALAVAPRHRGRAVGTALVEAAADRYDRLTAAFRPEVRAFWTGVGFEVVGGGDRLRGVRERSE